METNIPADEVQVEQSDQVEAEMHAGDQRPAIYRLALLLISILALMYFSLRISGDQRKLSQLEQTNQALQEEVADYIERLKITAGQLDLVMNAVTQARMQRDSGQKGLREMEDRVAESRLAREALEKQANAYRIQIEYLSKALEQAETALKEAANLPGYLYPGSYAQAAEFIASAYPNQGEILVGMVGTLGETKWKFAGSDPEEGFDSEGMAVYLLANCGLIIDPAAAVGGRLGEILEPASAPGVGDLVEYKEGYYMFFYLDPEGMPFVAGMTPYGVQLFKYEFKEIAQIFQVPYGEKTQCALIPNP